MINFSKCITNKEIYGSFYEEAVHIDVAFGVDHWFVPPMGIMMSSLLDNNRHFNVTFHVFLSSIDDEDKIKLKRLTDEYDNVVIKLYMISVDIYDEIRSPVQFLLTTATLHRFVAMSCLYPEVEKVLYVDADACCVGTLDELFSMPMDDYVLAAVKDGDDIVKSCKERLGMDVDSSYYNAGVLWVNLRKWNENNLSNKCMELLMKRDDLQYLDQDAINMVVGNCVKSIPDRYNYFGSLPKLSKDTIIIHYRAGKPWHPWFCGALKHIWEKYKNKSIWSDWYFVPRNYREERLMAKQRMKEGKIVSAIRWYIKYICSKLENNK